MKNLKLIMCAGVATLGLAWAGAAAADTAAAAPAPPAPTPMANPAMGWTIAANPHPATFDAGPFGSIVVDGVVSGMVMYQSPPAPQPFDFDSDADLDAGHNRDTFFDFTNAQVIINKSDGPVQFYFQAGAYSFPTLGVDYTYAAKNTPNSFGYLPQGFLKIVPTPNISIEAGALPTLIGAELGWTFQNINIERGLLWNTEPLVSKGAQVNVTEGPWAFSVALTDGYYTNKYSNISGLVSYTFKNSDVLVFAAEGNASYAVQGSLASGQVYNLIFTHNMGPLSITPYFQYQTTPNNAYSVSGSVYAGAILAKYTINSEWSIAGRVEYEASSGNADLLGFGPGSSAWSITITPTYQKGIFFARPEFSYVGLSHYARASCTPGEECDFSEFGEGFGSIHDQSSEYRFALESGFVF
jgi:hypothetical protein